MIQLSAVTAVNHTFVNDIPVIEISKNTAVNVAAANVAVANVASVNDTAVIVTSASVKYASVRPVHATSAHNTDVNASSGNDTAVYELQLHTAVSKGIPLFLLKECLQMAASKQMYIAIVAIIMLVITKMITVC